MIEKEGYKYKFDPLACSMCQGACCRGESGYIWIKLEEIKALAKFLNLEIEEFSKRYLKRVGHRYSLIEKKLDENDYACIFFDEKLNRCSIYEYRPSQCKTYPFWESFRGNESELSRECPGVILDSKDSK